MNALSNLYIVRRLMLFSIALFLMLQVQTVFSQVNFWTQTNVPATAGIRSLVSGPGGIVIAGSDGSGAFRTTNRGAAWSTVAISPTVYAMTSKPNLMFAGVDYDVYVSSNNGASWGQQIIAQKQIFSLAVGDSGHLFAGSLGEVHKSTDDGATWRSRSTFQESVNAIAFSAATKSLFVAVRQNGVFRSTDNGWTYIRKDIGIPANEYTALAANAAGDFFCGTVDGLYRSTNNGDSWQRFSNTPVQRISDILISEIGHIYFSSDAAAGGGVYRSTDNGTTWQIQNNGMTNTQIHCLERSGEDFLYAGANNGIVYRSTTPIDAVFVAPQSIDFGNRRGGGVYDSTFIIRNTGNGLLVIDQIISTDPAFTISRQNAQIAPKSFDTLTVRFSSPTDGPKTGTLRFRSNASSSVDAIALSGTLVRPVLRLETTAIDYGDIDVQTESVKTVRVYNDGTDLLSVRNARIVSGAGAFSIDPPVNFDIDPSGSRDFTIRFKPDVMDQFNGRLVFDHDAPPVPGVVNLTGRGVQGVLVASPSPLAFGEVRVSAQKALLLTLENTGARNLSVQSISSSTSEFFVAFQGVIIPQTSNTTLVTFTPSGRGAFAATLTIVHDGLNSPTIVNVSAQGVEAEIQFDRNSLAFNAVKLGDSKDLDIRITNVGNFELSISDIRTDDSAFTLTPITPFVLSPSASRIVNVSFVPGRLGSFNANLIVASDAPASPHNIPMSGTGFIDPVPIFGVNTNTLDYGNVPINTTKPLAVDITNTGNDVLRITGIVSSNPGVFVPDFNSKNIAGGRQEPLKIDFKPIIAGTVSALIILEHNASTSPDTVTVTGRGTEARFQAFPKPMDFGSKLLSTRDSMTLTIRNAGEADLVVDTPVISGSTAFTTTTQSPFAVGGGGTGSVLVIFTPVDEAVAEAVLEFRHNAGAGLDTIRLTGIGTRQAVPVWSVNTSNIVFGEVLIQVPAVSRDTLISIENKGTAALRIDALQFSNDRFASAQSLPLLVGIGDTRTIDIKFTPLSSGVETGTLTVTHNDATQSPSVINLQGTGVIADRDPVFQATPLAIDYGDVSVNGSLTKNLLIENFGNAELIITSLSTSEPFRVVGPATPFSILPNASRNVEIEFQPRTQGDESDTLTIIHNAQGAPASIPLRGRGVEPGVNLSRSMIDFGNVLVDGQKVEFVRITNTGQAPLEFLSAGIEDNTFQVNSAGAIILPTDSWDVRIEFSPVTPGLRNSELKLDFGSLGLRKIPLSGAGIGRTILVDVGTAEINEQVNLTITPPSGFQTESGSLYYRRAGERNYASGPIDPGANPWMFTVPGSYLTLRGLEYYLVLFNAQGDSLTMPEIDPQTNPAIVQVMVPKSDSPIQLQRETYRMISVPAELSDSTIASVLEDDFGPYSIRHWRLYHWDAVQGQYLEGKDIGKDFQPGAAFWVVTQAGLPFDIENAVSVNSAEPREFRLETGWNQIANPYAFNIAWKDVLIDAPGMSPVSVVNEPRISAPQFFDGESYKPLIEWLRPWEGFFVFNEIPDASLHFPATEDSTSQVYKRYRRVSETYGFNITLNHRSTGLTDRATVHFGDERPDEYRPLDYLKPPPISQYAHIGIVEEKYIVSQGYGRAGIEGSTVDLELKSNLDVANVEIGFAPFGVMPSEFNTYIVDGTTGSLIAKNQEQFNFRISSGAPARLRVILGTEHYARSLNGGRELIPSGVFLEDVHPNPVHTSAAFRYRIGESANVRFAIHDLLGRLVRDWDLGDQVPGYHSVAWDSIDRSGKPLQPGVYIYTLITGDQQQSKKLLLIP